MTTAVLWLYLLNFLAIGLLPVIFFRKGGALNMRWWATAFPFVVVPALLIASWLGKIEPLQAPTAAVAAGLELAGVTLSAASITLIAWTRGIHRIPLALWHQGNDAPQKLITEGPYAHVRHPFYLAFLLALLGAALVCPHPGVWAVFLYSAVILNATAAKEERKLLASAFGKEYERYIRRSGRFLPKWTSGA